MQAFANIKTGIRPGGTPDPGFVPTTGILINEKVLLLGVLPASLFKRKEIVASFGKSSCVTIYSFVVI